MTTTPSTTPRPVALEDRSRARFFGIRMDALKRMQFSGLLVVKGTQGSQWGLYFHQGELAWGVGGSHPQRRWQRLMNLHCPGLKLEDLAWVQMAAPMEGYMALLDMQRRNLVSREQAQAVILSTVAEVLFDILQETSGALTYSCEADKTLPVADLRPESISTLWGQVQDHWIQWQSAGLAPYSPNGIPVIQQADALKAQVPARVYFTLSRMINGRRTLRDLALIMKQELIPLAQSLLPFVQGHVIDIKTGEDLIPATPTPKKADQTPKVAALKIACIDDSPFVCEQMKQILTQAQHQFLGIQDSTQALTQLIEFKPDLIFLDLVMPVASGYEVCAQIRKMSKFKTTPVVILTGHDGMVDRVRAKIAGSTDFITKPVDAAQVGELIRKYTQPVQPPQSTVAPAKVNLSSPPQVGFPRMARLSPAV